MKKVLIATMATIFILVGGIFVYRKYFGRVTYNINKETIFKKQNGSTDSVFKNLNKSATEVNLIEPGSTAYVERTKHMYQTFNNCGPATLSMVLADLGTNVSQRTLGNKMRPYQNPRGDNDDKSVSTNEIVQWAKEYGYEGVTRPNGNIELLKELTTNGFDVIVTTWLNPDEDIGHYRIVRGYDDSKQVIIQDDSYQGKDLEFSYDDFNSIWQPFNYNYVVIYSPKDQEVVQAILGEEIDEQTAWKNALRRAEQEQKNNPQNPYPTFNISVASYYLENYKDSVEAYEKVQNDLPGRMLWYQIEPIKSYKELGNYEKALELIENILSNNNLAYSELYVIRGNIYLEQGNVDLAKENFELALKYNENSELVKEALKQL